jgi:hypothetical protein
MRVADDTLRELCKHGVREELDDELDGGPTAAAVSSTWKEMDLIAQLSRYGVLRRAASGRTWTAQGTSGWSALAAYFLPCSSV